jgi:tetratricopeptide (TPR) repeat protein
MEQPDRAIAQYQSAIDQMPHRLGLRLDLAELLVRLGRPQEAIEQYRQVLARDAFHELALRRLAILLYYLDEFAEARTILERLAEMMPGDAGVQLYLGRTVAGEGDMDGAIDHFQQAIVLDDSLADGWVSLGIACLQKEDYEGAEAVLKRGVLKLPDEPRILHLLGVSHLRRERYLLAVGALEGALALAPDHIGIMRDLAHSYERAGHFQKAVSLFQQVLSQQPDDHWAMNYLGYMLADAGIRLKQAEQLIEKALQLNPENGYYLDSMGWVYFRLGRFELAEEYLIRAIDELPDQAVMHDHLGDVYLQRGQLEKALGQWQKALQLSPDDEQIRRKLEQHRP